MKYNYLYFLTILTFLPLQIWAQNQDKIFEVRNPDIIPMTYHGLSVPVADLIPLPYQNNTLLREEDDADTKEDWIFHEAIDPSALPNGLDPAWQQKYTTYNAAQKNPPSVNFEGIGFSGVNPPDPSVDAGPNHIVQMINGPGGALVQIYNKTGTIITNSFEFDNLTGINGLGDPIVVYDHIADRWLLSEFSESGNLMVVGISQNSSPTGAFHIYSFQAPVFPDYPKFSLWPDAYYITSNESSGQAVYAIDRTQMLNGNAATMQRFAMPKFPTIGFQAGTPVSLTAGSNLPPAGSPGIIMRMADDAWSTQVNADRLEVWSFSVDFNTPSNSSLTGPKILETDPFDTDLCGYTSFQCVDQPGNINLDPLREVLMNRIMYYNYGSYEALVCNHVTDVGDVDDHTGVRWYELRKTPDTEWCIWQQSTYAPDAANRWMGAISLDHEGNIGLAYNVASNSIFPSIRYTGRQACDPLGTMTIAEESVIEGSASNSNFRYGDYNSMSFDPVSGYFWLVGEYNPTANWSTRIAAFDINTPTCTPEVSFLCESSNVKEVDANLGDPCLPYLELKVPVIISTAPSQPVEVMLTINNNTTANQGVNQDFSITPTSITLDASQLASSFTIRIYNDQYVENDELIDLGLSINSTGNAALASYNQEVNITIEDNEEALLGRDGITQTIFQEDFETANFNKWSLNQNFSSNENTTFALTNDADFATSQFWTVPDNNSGFFTFINDDDCNCDMANVKLVTPVLDLSEIDNALFSFDAYYENRNIETAQLEVSENNAPFTPVEVLTALNWERKDIDISAYTGPGKTNVRFALRYNDEQDWSYGLAFDNVAITYIEPLTAQLAVNTNNPTKAYLGSNATVDFYDITSGNMIATIENLSSHDFGCVTVSVDRQGVSPTTQAFASNNTNEYLFSKTLRIIPEFPNNSAAYNLTAYYQEKEIDAWETQTSNNRNAINIIKVEDASINEVTPQNFQNYTIVSESANRFDINAAIGFQASFTGMSGFGLGLPVNTNLAIDGLTFNGEYIDNQAIAINWTTLSEIDSDYFIVEHSIDGKTFTTIATVTAKGEAQKSSSYQYLHQDYVQGKNFYRLREIETTGKNTPSNIIVVKVKSSDLVQLFPNPVTAQLQLQFPEGQTTKVEITLTDLTGKAVMDTQTTSTNRHKINMSQLANGAYLVKVKIAGETLNYRILKSK